MAGFFKRLFARVTGKNRVVRRPSSEEIDDAILETIRSTQSKLERFLITRKVEQGLIQKSPRWSLHKNHTGLFRLDAEGMSILLYTEPFLVKRQDKIQGLLPISEVDLCRAAREKEPQAFLRAAGSPTGPGYEIYRNLLGDQSREVRYPAIEELVQWAGPDVHRLLSGVRMNVVAHVLVQASDPVRSVLLKNSSRRYREMMITELDSLRSPGSDPDLNPGSRNLGLLQFDQAIAEFRKEMHRFQADRESNANRRARVAASSA